jgi:hypothetical protein
MLIPPVEDSLLSYTIYHCVFYEPVTYVDSIVVSTRCNMALLNDHLNNTLQFLAKARLGRSK